MQKKTPYSGRFAAITVVTMEKNTTGNSLTGDFTVLSKSFFLHLVLQFGHETHFLRHCVLKQRFNSGFIIMQRFLVENQLQVLNCVFKLLHYVCTTNLLCKYNSPLHTESSAYFEDKNGYKNLFCFL